MVYLRVISSFREGFIFAKIRFREVSKKYNPRENFEFTTLSIHRNSSNMCHSRSGGKGKRFAYFP